MAHSPFDEFKAISHFMEQVTHLMKAGIERMVASKHRGDHPMLSEVARPIGHYLHEIVDANGDGTVTTAEVSQAAASFDHDASVVGKAASVILKELRPMFDVYG